MVERFWSGATTDAARAAVQRPQTSCLDLARRGVPIGCLGATFVPADESLSCRFDGTTRTVRAAYEAAGATFDRLVVIHETSPRAGTPEEELQ